MTTRRVLVAGTAGGVGTTTVTALLFRSWSGNAGAPQLADHTAGSLFARLTDGDEVGRIDDGTLLVDAGPLGWALVHGAERADPPASFVLVTAATPVGCDLAFRCSAEGSEPRTPCPARCWCTPRCSAGIGSTDRWVPSRRITPS